MLRKSTDNQKEKQRRTICNYKEHVTRVAVIYEWNGANGEIIFRNIGVCVCLRKF